MKLYDASVDLSLNLESLYDSTYKVNSTDMLYKFKQENAGMYEYSIYAVHNKVQYVIEYTGTTNDITNFLTEFFA